MLKTFAARLAGASFAILCVTGLNAGATSAADLNALVWCDHSDPNLLKPFEDANGIKVNVKEFEGTGGWAKESSRVQAVCDWFGRMDIYKTAMEEKARGATEETWVTGDVAERLSALIGGVIWENPYTCRWASPITYVSGDDAPFLIMHGDKDDVVPLDQSVAFHEALKKAGVDSTLQIVKDVGHSFPGRPDLGEPVVEFFEKHLGKGSKQK